MALSKQMKKMYKEIEDNIDLSNEHELDIFFCGKNKGYSQAITDKDLIRRADVENSISLEKEKLAKEKDKVEKEWSECSFFDGEIFFHLKNRRLVLHHLILELEELKAKIKEMKSK